MPQFDFFSFFVQLFWLIFSFFAFYLLYVKQLPKLGTAQKIREKAASLKSKIAIKTTALYDECVASWFNDKK